MGGAACLSRGRHYSLLEIYIISGFLISTALWHRCTPDGRGLFAFYRSWFVRIFSL
jgi:hypothetical protein